MVEFVSINGAQLAYRLIGPANAPLIITLHGGRGFGSLNIDEWTAIHTLEQRASKAPGLSIKFLKDKIFGRFESDLEFRLVMYAAAPLYSEHFDPDIALKHNIETVFYAKSHNDLYAEKEKYFDYRDQLHSITAKTLVIVGDRDWICPPEQSKTIASKIPGAALKVIANANHGVHLEKNAEVIELIKEHIR
ncbi:hypothetical protein PITC_096510 [Penicillium italicum]|uniref:AB hydrolase-1 domain-containing protein n=1 Tax=Penicillium italicum TaxID=40296 RepID=A0A0A2KTV6_PENIT|nr:hypothetical protein PITC_096510 [Penicillium italicum]